MTDGSGAIEVLISEEEISHRIDQLAAQISRDYAGRELLLVCVLKGAWIFMADLMRRISIPCRADFLAVSSYGDASVTSGAVKIIADLTEAIGGRDVLLVEDIIDSGLTVSYLLTILSARRPRSLKLCALLDKKERRRVTVPIDYRGFSIPDRFVVGYGLDSGGLYRHLPFVGVVTDPCGGKNGKTTDGGVS
jgi:hypoxanthine phosphoribosyltransferase